MAEGETESPSGLARAWLTAAGAAKIAGALEGVYEDVAREIKARGPACWASGRCCNFEKTGHRLYVTGLEAAYAVARRGECVASSRERGRIVTLEQIGAARARGDCPFLRENLCGIHRIKPLGCRVYFCDRSAGAWQHALSERALDEIKRIHDLHSIPYRYGEWREMLEMFAGNRRGD